jgi:hypothetical protein
VRAQLQLDVHRRGLAGRRLPVHGLAARMQQPSQDTGESTAEPTGLLRTRARSQIRTQV